MQIKIHYVIINISKTLRKLKKWAEEYQLQEKRRSYHENQQQAFERHFGSGGALFYGHANGRKYRIPVDCCRAVQCGPICQQWQCRFRDYSLRL